MTPEVVKLSLNDIPCLFNFEQANKHCALDIVSYVRGRLVRNPWVPVILDTTGDPVSYIELESYGIFWKGTNDNKASSQLGISLSTYCAIDISKLNDTDEDCGFEKAIADYREEFSINSFDVIISCMEDSEYRARLSKLRKYVVDCGRADVVFPTFVVKETRALPNGLDLSEAAHEIRVNRYRNALDYKFLNELLDRLNSKVIPGVTVLQDLHEQRTYEVKLLMNYLTLKHMLPPIYVSSFIMEYIEFEWFYPRKKLSLFERISFLRRLPSVVGFLGRYQEFNCLANVERKIYPHPHYVFNLSTHQVLEDPEDFTLDNPAVKVADFRQMFSGSHTMCIDMPLDGRAGANEALAIGASDMETDNQLRVLFSELAYLVSDESVYPSIKNCLLCERDGERYVLYCPEECGVELSLVSSVFGGYRTVVPESEFCYICDAQIEKALLSRARVGSRKEATNALAVTWSEFDPKYAMKPAIPLEVTMRSMLLPPAQSGLSYYDICLRCSPDVLPTVTSVDSKAYDVSPVFGTIMGQTFLGDSQVREAVTCFGTLGTHISGDVKVPITYKVMQGGLL